MSEIYEKCRLGNLLKEKKKKLNKMIEDKNFNLLDEDILKLSKEIDEVMHRYILN